jgi:hypothetical protein
MDFNDDDNETKVLLTSDNTIELETIQKKP